MLLKLLHNFFIIGFPCPNSIWKVGSSRTEYSSFWYTKPRDCSDVIVLLAFMGRKAQKMHRSYKQHSWKNCFCSSTRHPTHPLMELSQNFLHRKQLLFHLFSLFDGNTGELWQLCNGWQTWMCLILVFFPIERRSVISKLSTT